MFLAIAFCLLAVVFPNLIWLFFAVVAGMYGYAYMTGKFE